MIHKGVFNIITTTFLALSYDVAIIISSIRTLNRLCSLSGVRAAPASRLAFAVSLFVRSPLLLDSVYTTRNHPFNEPLWSAVLDLLLTVQTTAAGRAALRAKKIQMEIRSCLCLLKGTASVVAKASSLLDSLEPSASEAHPEANLETNPETAPETAHGTASETAPETASETQTVHRLQPVSPLRPRTASVSHIELSQRPLQQQLSTRAAPGTDFLSMLLFMLADDGAHAFAYRAVECLFDLLDEGGAARRA